MPKLSVFLNLYEGLFGLHIKKNNQVTPWKKLTYDDRDRIIRYMEQILTVCKANKFDK